MSAEQSADLVKWRNLGLPKDERKPLPKGLLCWVPTPSGPCLRKAEPATFKCARHGE